jgi:hypothetical protein
VSKISELSDGGSLVSSDYLIAVRSGGNVKVRMDQINVDQVDLGDNEFIRLGNSQDLTMVHTSTQSIINQAGTGDLLIQKAGATKASITANGLEFPDNSKAIFGAGSDLQIYHDPAAGSIIQEGGSGSLFIRASTNIQLEGVNGENMAIFNENGSVQLYYDNSARLATSASGIGVTGTVTATGTSVFANLDISGDVDIDGTTNLDVVDIDGAVDMASTLAVGSTIAIGQTSFSGGSILLDLHGSGSGAGSQASFYNDHNTSGFQIGLAGNTSGDVIFYNVANTDMDFYTNNLLRFSIAADGSLSTPTLGTSNVRFGVNAGNSIIAGGNYNTVVGDEAGTAISTASSNTAVGYQAGYSNETGGGNTFIGNAAGLAVTTGGNNLLVGNSAGVALTTGLSNTFVGAYSNSGSGACGGAMTTGSKNTIIGGYSGNQGGLDIRTTSNYIVLSDGDGNPRLWSNNLGRIFVPEVYTGTTAAAANVVVAASGQLERSTSSIKYKRDVQNATHGLAEVLQLRPVTYKGKGENDGETVFGGLIAEEVHEAGLTEFVQYAADGSPDALAYGNMVSLLTKAIQEQQAIIDSLTARIEALES